ncbi:glycosyltransferase [Spiroplasma helicoides]|uniref:Glycosyltransferase n=1 Tax=Spiroplasma helicoides TaxID=216938 RepID=A0A1B3SJE8_9MOLU|nr:glycosyltransferase family 2 protein [Spiroplasma helicoides]AOG60058.1 glycosyltransferase [Spiroplasma helicoides]
MLVSFVLVTDGKHNTLEKSIDSIFTQTNEDYEVILICDNTMFENAKNDYVKNLFWKSKNIKLILNSSFQGASVSWNNAIDLAEGQYIKFLGQGDYVHKNYVEEIKNVIDRNATNKIDVLEYKVKFTDLGEGEETKVFLESNKIYNLKSEFHPFALTNVSLFNKIYRLKLLKDFGFRFRRFVRFDLLFVYKVLGQTENYIYIGDNFLEEKSIQPVQHSAFDQVNQWTHITNYYRRIAKYKELKDYLNYAYYKAMCHIWLWLIIKYDNKLLIKKAANFVLKKFSDKREDFIQNNKVFIEKRDSEFTEVCLDFSKYIKDILKQAK